MKDAAAGWGRAAPQDKLIMTVPMQWRKVPICRRQDNIAVMSVAATGAGQGRAGQGQDLHGHKAQPGKLEAGTAVAGLHQPQQHQAKCEERHHQSTQPQLHNREPSALSASTEDMMSTCQARRASSVPEI